MASWAAIARRVRVPLGFAFAVVYLWLAKPTATSILLGCAVAVPGLFIRALASGHVQKNEQLTTTGPYAYARNPLYLGSLILALGFGLAARSWWIAVGIVLMFFAIYWPVIIAEEDFLRTRFPEFKEYALSVPRLLPRMTRHQKNSAGFSWKLYKKHREYNAPLGSLAMLAALLVKIWWK